MRQLIILIFLVHNISNSQSEVGFKFYNTCNDSVVKLDYFMNSEDLFNTKDYYYTNDSIVKVKPGKYKIDAFIKEYGLDYKIFTFTKNFDDKETYNDTIELPKVLRKYRDTSQYAHIYFGYFKCNEICDGYITDYYSNGKIRLEGNFENGMPKNEIKKYDNSGKLVKVEIYDNDGTLKKVKYIDH